MCLQKSSRPRLPHIESFWSRQMQAKSRHPGARCLLFDHYQPPLASPGKCGLYQSNSCANCIALCGVTGTNRETGNYLGDIDGVLVSQDVPQPIAGHDDHGVPWQQLLPAHIRYPLHKPEPQVTRADLAYSVSDNRPFRVTPIEPIDCMEIAHQPASHLTSPCVA